MIYTFRLPYKVDTHRETHTRHYAGHTETETNLRQRHKIILHSPERIKFSFSIESHIRKKYILYIIENKRG